MQTNFHTKMYFIRGVYKFNYVAILVKVTQQVLFNWKRMAGSDIAVWAWFNIMCGKTLINQEKGSKETIKFLILPARSVLYAWMKQLQPHVVLVVH